MIIAGGQIWAVGWLFQGFPVEFLQFIPSQNGCVRPGIVVEQNHISDWLNAPFGLVCGFHIVQKLAVVCDIHSTTFVKEVDEQYTFPVPKNGCENFSS
jgi:cytochrome bd-type quinol oxidase subunit 2